MADLSPGAATDVYKTCGHGTLGHRNHWPENNQSRNAEKTKRWETKPRAETALGRHALGRLDPQNGEALRRRRQEGYETHWFPFDRA